MTLAPFFHPRGIAVIGVSSDPVKLGYAVARNLIRGGYSGSVHLVNPRGGELFGQKIFPRLTEIPDPVDLAVIIVPALATLQTLREVGERGIRAAILTSGGFREVGPQGAKLEKQVVALCKEYDIRLIGPNCIGLMDTHLPLDTTFLPSPPPPKGNIAFLSHSGAFCAAVIDWSHTQGFGFSRLVSLGNQADVTESDLLPAIAEDPHTRAICLYLESITNGSKFLVTTREIARQTPIVALKVGRTASGQKAAASHTGALAGSESALNAAFEKAGIYRAASAQQMFDWAQALAACPLPLGKNTAILTNAGGPGVIAADELELQGLSLATLTPQTIAQLTETLPPAASLHNPIDMLASASPAQYAACLSALLADPGVDGVLVILPPSPNHPTETIAEALIPLIQASAKPVLVSLMGSHLVYPAHQRFANAGIPTYKFPERAASALGKLAERAGFLRKIEADVPALTALRIPGAPPAPEISPLASNNPEAVFRLMDVYDIPNAPIQLACSSSEARRLAAALGFPLVLKIASPDILHKSDIGGVLLDVNSAEAAAKGFKMLMERARLARPDATIDGVHLQRQVPPGQEVILGMTRDPQFGPLMMFGSGGVEVEGLKDIAFALAPLSEAEAEGLLQKTWAGRKLDGFRSIPPADRVAVIRVLIQLSRLALEHPEISEIEINPLRVLAQGAVAVDVRV